MPLNKLTNLEHDDGGSKKFLIKQKYNFQHNLLAFASLARFALQTLLLITTSVAAQL